MRKNWGRIFKHALRIACLGAAGVLWLSLPISAASDQPASSAAEKMGIVTAGIPAASELDTLSTIFTRRSVRKYADKPVSDATVKLLLQAAMSAPTAK